MNAHLAKPVPTPARLHYGWIVALVTFVYLPVTLNSGAHGLGWFAVFYGLDWQRRPL